MMQTTPATTPKKPQQQQQLQQVQQATQYTQTPDRSFTSPETERMIEYLQDLKQRPNKHPQSLSFSLSLGIYSPLFFLCYAVHL